MKNNRKLMLVTVAALSTLANSNAQAITPKNKIVAREVVKAGASAAVFGLAVSSSYSLLRDALYTSKLLKNPGLSMAKPVDADDRDLRFESIVSGLNHRYKTSLFFSGVAALIAYKAFKSGYKASVRAGLLSNSQAPKKVVRESVKVIKPSEVLV
ncbi:hypothetical protein H0X48_02770 [Candidatus Dependentiae bacterium]|nr:hypothetical protein [Candidatus Dependentiae bacterium]